MFGDERLAATIVETSSIDVELTPGRIGEEVDRFVGDARQQDDITVTAAEVV